MLIWGVCLKRSCGMRVYDINSCVAAMAESLHDAPDYGFAASPGSAVFDWNQLKVKRDAYIARLNGYLNWVLNSYLRIYETNLTKDAIDRISGFGTFVGPRQVKVNDIVYEAQKILITVGSYAWIPSTPGCQEHGITSDGFFELQDLPKKVAVVGAGYIGVELAGIFQGLGAQTSLFIRHTEFLRTFDPIIRHTVMDEYRKSGMNLVTSSQISQIENLAPKGSPKNLRITTWNHETQSNQVHEGFEHVIFAVGRKANIEKLDLSAAGVTLNAKGFITVNEYQDTNVSGIYALGDVCGVAMLTPVAIAAGRRLADRLFGGKTDSKLDYSNIASVIFSHPTCGSVGLSEDDAVAKYGRDQIKVYQSKFTNMYFSMTTRKQPTVHKLVCAGPEEKVVGLHIVGLASDEILQGFAVAVKMGTLRVLLTS